MHRALKADLHTHSADDPRDALLYSTEMLIDAAAEKGVEVLALTLHEWWTPSPRVARYAERKGVLLLPAIEQCVEGVHILILNPDEEQARACTFANLRALGRRNAAFIAPHPYYPLESCLKSKLLEHIDLFDAIEYCTLYARGVNWPNRRAARVAKQYGLPLVGTSDTHMLPYVDLTHTLIDGEKSVAGVVEAIREGRVDLVTQPRSWGEMLNLVVPILHGMLGDTIARAIARLGWKPTRPATVRVFAPGDLHLPHVPGHPATVSAP